jgi:glycosyltransferase involved in cell wall biosynthesis
LRIAVAFDCLFPWTTGGGERQYRAFAEEFARAGHHVTYLTRQQWDGEPPTIEGLDIEVVSTDRELYTEHGRRTLGPAIRFARGLFGHLRQHRCDYDAVLVSSTPVTNVFATRAALAGTKIVVIVDWLEVWRPNQWREYSGPLVGGVATVLQWLAVWLSPIASCHSQLNARRLLGLGVPAEPVVSPGLIHAEIGREPSLAAAQPPRVIYVGRHLPNKRIDALPAAISYAREKIPELKMTIFGAGPTHDAVLAEIDRLGLSEVVAMPGFVSQAELDHGIRTASCLVNPSMWEGYGLVVVESCAAGTPVVLVAGEDNAAVELIDEGVNGRIAASVAPEELGAAIVDVVEAGEPLRQTTLAWFETASRTKTLRATATQILARMESAVCNVR